MLVTYNKSNRKPAP